ncbi:MAG: hypothetical protein QNJ12_21170 [Ilumatobacter sp.]|uniref:hypothetical protein n=1 Tax=Ilumatobacter sp. TaxID=1967498 RepID=UPI002633053F|nr:hypothetical protein [Ilumatobacter sp.]MDJ0771313.1 hypothetical protein [Ilumatobacter sp.]
METKQRVDRLERICRMQQALLDHQLNLISELRSRVGMGGGTHMLDDQDWNALSTEVRNL